MENNFNIHEWQAKYLKEEQDPFDREMFELQQQIIPLLKDYIDSYKIDLEAENPDDTKYVPYRKQFLKELENVLFKLQHGEI